LVIPVEEQVLKWLKEGRDDAEDIVDFPWNVKKQSEHVYLAEYPKIPFVLNVVFTEGFVHLIVPFGLETVSLEPSERLKLYHTLLLLNDKINLLKFTLSGFNEEIVLRVDLDRKSLGKEEFNDALTSLLIGVNELVKALGLEKDFARSIFERVALMIIERLQRGATKKDLVKFLVVKVGMKREEAEAFIDEIIKAQKEEERKSSIGYV